MIRTNSPKAWLLAARPKTLTAAFIPVLLGSALAFSDRMFETVPALLCLLFAFFMQIAANFINDLFDFQKGTDREDRLGPKRACAEGWITPRAMRMGICVTLTFACLCGLGVLFTTWGNLPHGGWELVLLGVVCLLFAFLYTTVLSYHGWGDVLVLVFFGFIPVGGTYYVQTGELNMDVLLLSVIAEYAKNIVFLVPDQPRALSFEELEALTPKGVSTMRAKVQEVYSNGKCLLAEDGDVVVSTGSI